MVSIVIPAYNCQDKISDCIESIMHQVYTDWEVIIIDDGSKDSTLDVCCQYESDKIRIFHQSNRGVSLTRNKGIEHCSDKSEYLFFVDSDDVVNEGYISSMLECAEREALIVCGYNRISENIHNFNTQKEAVGFAEILYPYSDKRFLECLKIGLINPLWNKCYDLKIVRDFHIRLPLGYPEDIRFNLEYLKHCKKVKILEKKLYNYLINKNSVTTKGYIELYDNYMKIQEYLLKNVPKEMHHYVTEFVYPQYLANTRKFIKSGEIEIPKKYLKEKLIKDSIKSHKSTCIGDAFIKYCFLFGVFNLI